MRLLRLLVLIGFGLWQWSLAVPGAEYRLNSGDVLRGEAVSFNDDGLVVRLQIGGHSPRISWSKLTQETLLELMKNPEAAKFVEPFIDVPPVPKDKEKKAREITLKPVPRVERVGDTGLFAALATPAGLVIFLVLFAANLYAAYEIARYRYRPPGLVCGLSILFPVIAPAMFLAMPPAQPTDAEAAGMAEAGSAGTAGKVTTGPLAKVPMASGLSIAQAEKAGASAAGAGPQSFKRGEFTFNRRFIETKFAGFFRVVPGEAERDMVLVVRAGRDRVHRQASEPHFDE